MGSRSGEDMGALLVHSQRALGMLQVDLARFLGVSTRTLRRWTDANPLLHPSTLLTLTEAVHAKDPALAARIAAAHERTLEDLGVGVLPPPLPPPAAAPRDRETERLLADGILSAAAEIADLSPRVMRPALVAALDRARQAGLTLEAMCALLARPPLASKSAPSRPQDPSQ